MRNSITQCFCCNSKEIKKFISVKNFPYFTTPIDIKNKLNIKNLNKKDYFDNLNLKSCKKCNHIFLSNLPKLKIINELYSKYYSYPSAMLGNFIPTRDIQFVSFLKKLLKKKKTKKNSSFFEIGCYDGYVLHNLRSAGFPNISGCDPSIGADIGKKFGIKIEKKFFSSNTKNLKNKKFDFIIARHLVEHLDNPKKFFQTLTKFTHEKSRVVIEAPNGDYYIKHGLVEVFSHQHIHLFNKYSMSMLINQTDFSIEQSIHTEANLYFILSINKTKKIYKKKNLINTFTKNYNNKVRKIEKFIKKFKNKKIIFYGAGGFCCAAIHLYNINKKIISSIVDSDQKKINKEFLDIDVSIKSNKNFDEFKDNLLVITSYYTKDIIRFLKKNKVTTNILAIHPEVMLYKIIDGK